MGVGGLDILEQSELVVDSAFWTNTLAFALVFALAFAVTLQTGPPFGPLSGLTDPITSG